MNIDWLGPGTGKRFCVFLLWILKRFGSDRHRHRTSQFQTLLFIVYQRADRLAGNILAFEIDRGRSLANPGVLIETQRFGLHL